MVWQSAGRLPAASRAMTSGSSPKRDCPVTSASKAGSRSRSSASASRSAVVRRPLRAGETVPTWLARMPRRLEWNAPPSERRDLDVAVPAEVDHRALGREQLERPLKPGGRRAGVHDEVAAVGGVGRQREVDPERVRHLGPVGVDVDERHLQRGEPTEQACHAAADHPGADDGDPVAEERCGVPHRVDGGLDGARENGTSGRHVLGHDGHRRGRHHVGGLVRVQAEHRAAAQLRRSPFDGADVEVAVLDRSWEVAFLKRGAHGGVLGRGHTAPEDQRLGASADAGPHGAHQHLVGPRLGQRDRTDLPAARGAQPERLCVGLHGRHLARPRPERSRGHQSRSAAREHDMLVHAAHAIWTAFSASHRPGRCRLRRRGG